MITRPLIKIYGGFICHYDVYEIINKLAAQGTNLLLGLLPSETSLKQLISGFLWIKLQLK
jgi:hypothetical protein